MSKFSDLYALVAVYVWRAAEIHVYKLIIVVIGIFCLHKVTNFAYNLFFFRLIFIMF